MSGKTGLGEGQPGLKIETIRGPADSEVSYCPERGGIVTSLKFRSREILYLDAATFKDIKSNVKGGIPILFPNAGPIDSPQFPGLAQHGFARSAKWHSEKQGSSFTQALTSNDETKKIFPYDFKLSVGGQFRKDGSFSISQSIQNTGEIAMPVSMGLHPYFNIARSAKKDIKFNFEGGKSVEDNVDKWANGEAFFIDNPKIQNPDGVMEIVIPYIGTILMDASKEYRKIWIWSLPEGDFICIEPVMRNPGGLIADPEIILPQTSLRAVVNIKLKESV